MQLRQIAEDRVPLKGREHSINPGFSSNAGVHISMTRFDDILIREGYRTVEVETRLMWTDVYGYLVPEGFNVFGGRLDGVWRGYACGRIFYSNKRLCTFGGLGHGIPPRITNWIINSSD